MAGFITENHLELIRSIYGQDIADACRNAPAGSTFLGILHSTPAERIDARRRAAVTTRRESHRQLLASRQAIARAAELLK